MMRLAGLIPPLCTPLAHDGSIDVPSLRSLIEFQLEAGATGIFVLGSSGEAIYLDDAERRQVAEAAAGVVGGRVPLLIGALAPTTRRVIQQMGMLADVGADAFVVTAPFYAQPSPQEVAAHFRKSAAASPLPVLIYDIPGNVGYKIAPEIAVAVLRDGTIAGLKDSSGSLEDFARVAVDIGTDRVAALLSGADTTALRALEAGADGLIPGLANVRPDLFVDLLTAHAAGDRGRAGVIQDAIVTLNGIFRIGQEHGLGRHASEIGALKNVLVDRGVIRAPLSPEPLEPYPPAAREALLDLMAEVERQLRADLAAVEGAHS